MKKKSAKNNLKECSWVYLGLGILVLFFLILVLFIPFVYETIKEIIVIPNSYGPKRYICSILLGTSIYYFLLFWLIRRYASGKGKGIILIIILVWEIVGHIVNFIKVGNSRINIVFVIDAITLYYLVKSKE